MPSVTLNGWLLMGVQGELACEPWEKWKCHCICLRVPGMLQADAWAVSAAWPVQEEFYKATDLRK